MVEQLLRGASIESQGETCELFSDAVDAVVRYQAPYAIDAERRLRHSDDAVAIQVGYSQAGFWLGFHLGQLLGPGADRGQVERVVKGGAR
jgi:hypothetical protein